jgi:hypothetical protein
VRRHQVRQPVAAGGAVSLLQAGLEIRLPPAVAPGPVVRRHFRVKEPPDVRALWRTMRLVLRGHAEAAADEAAVRTCCGSIASRLN